MHLVSFVLESGLFIALIVIYALTLNDFMQIDYSTLQYYSDNACSDGPLQAAFTKLA
jgi:hypothetical protein